ncbi:MAG TPA: thrombospondin type 3 repeat-containing protein, partial [Kofleriaceae bacterium]|nr:thrombospondin type 3 repeat-containing protein [Kofleriaceae bacterium]
ISVPFSPDQGTADNEYQLEFVKGSSVVPTPQVPLAAGERVDVIVTPHVVNRIGSVSGALEVTSDAGGSRKVMLNGIATSAKVKIPSSLEFGVVDINGPPLMKTVTIENTGDGTLDIRSIGAISATPGGVPNPAFTIMAPSALPQLPPNGKLDIPVIYRPTVASDADAGDAVVLTAQLEGSLSATATVMITGNAVFTEAHGGGGCSAGRGTAGGAAGGALLIGVAAAVALRRRRRLAGLAAPAAAVMIALAPAARADDIGIAVFEPTPATMTAGFALQAPDVGPSGSWVMNAVASYASHPLVLISLDSGGDHVATTTRVERSTLMQIGAAYALFDRLELGAHLPLYQQSGDTDKQDTSQSAVTGTALGNLAVHAKARLVQLGGAAGTFVAGASAAVVLPTASSGQFTGSDQAEGRALLLGSFTPSALSSRLALSINAGPVVRAKSEFANVIEGSGAAWGAGAAIRISDELWATGELFGEVTPSGLRRQGMDGAPGRLDTLVQLEWLAGLTVRPDRRFSLGLAVGRGVTDAVGTPELRGVLSLSVVPGAAAVAPVHPPEPVKIDGDADGDGIRDSVDKCPNEPEDKDMFEDDDGCPDPDNDHDGIPDALDKCPLDPEDKDGFQDDDGCPDKDNDGDGIPDTLDKCPNEPEDKDLFEDEDGCPDPDNDHDGIPDALDKCPNAPE